jgi:tRNA nucleotidyltransferase/poly(A) polymerase
LPINLATFIPEPYLGHLKFIHQTILSAGYECYLVGGSVRDLYMNTVPKEYDLTTSAPPNKIKSLFKSVIETGIKHGTVTVLLEKSPYEITTYRIDKDYTDGRRPDSVEFGTSLEEDLKRRDFTMNALAMDLSTGDIIDLHKGREDIDQRVIRTIGSPIQRFSEDGLRPIRAMRFASVLNFSIDPETRLAIRSTRSITAKISVERFQDEVVKSLKGKSPQAMLRLLVEEDTFSLFVPDLTYSPGSFLDQKYLNLLDAMPKTELGYLLGLAAYCLRPDSTPSDWERMLHSLKFSNASVRDAIFFYSVVQDANTKQVTPNDFEMRKQFLAPLKKHLHQKKATADSFWESLHLIGHMWQAKAQLLWKENPPLLIADLAINGKDLEREYPSLPKPKYGELLNSLLDLVLEVPEKNNFPCLSTHSAHIISKL